MMTEEEIIAQYGGVPLSEDEIIAQYGGVPVNFPINKESPYFLNQVANSPTTEFVLGAGDALVNLPKQLANMLAPQNMQIPLSESGSGGAYNSGQLVGDIAGFVGGGIPLNAARASIGALPYIGKLANSLGGSGFSGVARRGIGSGLYGAIQEPEDRIGGASLAGGISAALDTVLGGASKLLPRKLFRGNLSPQELQTNLEAARGTQTPLGDVIGSPSLKFVYENVLNRIYGSGTDKVTGKLVNDIVGKGENILERYSHSLPENEVIPQLGNILNNSYKSEKKLSGDLYRNSNDMANDIKLNIRTPSFEKSFNKYGNSVDESMLNSYLESDELNTLNKLINPEPKFNMSTFTYEKETPTLSEINLLASKLNRLGKSFKSSPDPNDRYFGSILQKLGIPLKNDLKDSIKSSGNNKLISEFSKAEKNYSENYGNFFDKDIYKFVGSQQRSSDDLLSTFIKTGGTHDKADQLNKLIRILPEEGKDLVRYGYLSRALKGSEEARQISPGSLATLWKDTKLGIRQKEILFPNKSDRKELDNFTKLSNMNSNALNRMLNNPTGQKNADLLSLGLAASSGFGMGKNYGGLMGGITGATLMPAIMGLGAKVPAKFLHSPKIREKLVSKMIEDSFIEPSSLNSKDILRAALIDAFNSKTY
jgi:hypothetical protein